MKVLRQGQCLKHTMYGIGIAKSSNDDKTVIDFYEHGTKMFITQLLDAELVDDAPARPPKPRAAGAGAKKSAGAAAKAKRAEG